MTTENSLTTGLRASLKKAEDADYAGRAEIDDLVERQRDRKRPQTFDPPIKLAVNLDRRFHTRIKLFAVANHLTIEEIARDALEDYMKKFEGR